MRHTLIEQLKQRVESLIDAMVEDRDAGKSQVNYNDAILASRWVGWMTEGIREFAEDAGIIQSVEKFVFNSSAPIILVAEDSRRTLVVENPPENDSEMSIQISEFDDSLNHSDIRKLEGKKIRITIEILD